LLQLLSKSVARSLFSLTGYKRTTSSIHGLSVAVLPFSLWWSYWLWASENCRVCDEHVALLLLGKHVKLGW